MAEISVIVPVYKAEKTLSTCVDSILAQSFRDLELILIDDGSPDHSGAICDALAKDDSRIRVIHKANGGVSSARNTGLDVAAGNYVLFVDSDDRLYPDYAWRLYETKADLTICGLDICRENGQSIQTIRQNESLFRTKSEIDFPRLYADLALYSPYCKLFRRDIIEAHGIRFPVDISWGEDGMFVADYLVHAQTVCTLEYVGYCYIKYPGEGNLSTRVRENIIDMVCNSREYCIEKVHLHAPWAYEETTRVCSEDIRCNCAGFVAMLLRSQAISTRKKKKLMARFFENRYVKQTFANPRPYYAPDIIQCLQEKSSRRMVSRYLRLHRRRSQRNALLRAYENLPEWVKNAYRSMKGLIYHDS